MRKTKKTKKGYKPSYQLGGTPLNEQSTLDITQEPQMLQAKGYEPLYGQVQYQQTQQNLNKQVQPVNTQQKNNMSFNQGVNTYGNAIGAAGTAIGTAMSENMGENEKAHYGTGPSATQSAVGSAGAWGAAISGVSQIGTSAGDSVSGEVDKYGVAADKDSYVAGQAISTVFSPSSAQSDIVMSDEYTDEEKMAVMFNPLLSGEVQQRAAKRRQEEGRKKEQKEFQRMSETRLAGYDSKGSTYSFAKGGKMPAAMQNYVKGGQLQPISPDAVQVKANQPGVTDSVELPQAFVDHNEIIDNKDRVFSDVVKTPDGKKTIAQEAKRLEKMKDKNQKGGKYNEFINSKLDKLFNYQESINKQSLPKEGLQTGGELPKKKGKVLVNSKEEYENLKSFEPVAEYYGESKGKPYSYGVQKDPYKDYYSDINIFSPYYHHPVDRSMDQKTLSNLPEDRLPGLPQFYDAPYDRSLAKPALQHGGYHADPDNPRRMPRYNATRSVGPIDYSIPYEQQVNIKGVDASAMNTPMETLSASTSSPNKVQDAYATANRRALLERTGNQVASGLGTYGSNIYNQYLINKTPEVPEARLQGAVNLQRMSIRDRLAEQSRQRRLAGLAVDKNTAQSAAGNAARASMLANELSASNRLVGENNRLNARIAGREAMMNSQIEARNLGALSLKDAREVERLNRMNTLRSQNVADVSNKYMLSRREQNQMELDRQRLALLNQMYKDTGVAERNLYPITDEHNSYLYRRGI